MTEILLKVVLNTITLTLNGIQVKINNYFISFCRSWLI